ncbi:adenylosuccinate synthase [Wolbachia endosymbiont of Dirofilaria (Dirofilaria) immitis]|uniref:adenylosuccinate synthase n=1 Tax=Wolbachia endosymbiont of Dirofilaria (Dirofilaria) immitis TaxID=1812115 RepID=UPI00158D2E98|nr:adenylosuccinate synthase [Wolbachia endosymbiont of Dirofilaria (Dirofilaria) immitis]QKX02207.1 adenylosuccinate synthase [Wolbachia endosymbiont of Dirofilaria (Dirofilaria) immitis]
MNNIVIVGLQWGDEGKGKIVDYLSENASVVVRFQGGNNAGHTIVVDGEVYKLNLLPSAVLRTSKISIIGNGVALDLHALISEIELLKNRGIDINPNNLMISESCPLILSVHKDKERLFENLNGNHKIGTTNKGIGPCYEDKVGRRAIRLCDLENIDELDKKVDTLLSYHNAIRQGLSCQVVRKEEVLKEIKKISRKILPYKKPVWRILNDLTKEGKEIIFEGAQGTFLDVDHGTYPFVTSSNTVASQAIIGSGFSFNAYVIGVAKAYTTRVGNGPFPTEQKNEVGDSLFSIGKELGTVSNRKRRCGWFDAVLVRQAVQLSGVSSVILTKLDILDSFDKIKICTGYGYNGSVLYDYLPALHSIQGKLEPIYEEFPGWRESTQGKRLVKELPTNLIRYIRRVEELVGVPIHLISTSPKREDVIKLRDFKLSRSALMS